MRTVNLKIAANGAMLLAHPGAKPGPVHLVYAIGNVPDDVPAAQVCRQVSRVCLAHATSDVSAWSYDWPELATLPLGSIINRYPPADHRSQA